MVDGERVNLPIGDHVVSRSDHDGVVSELACSSFLRGFSLLKLLESLLAWLLVLQGHLRLCRGLNTVVVVKFVFNHCLRKVFVGHNH